MKKNPKKNPDLSCLAPRVYGEMRPIMSWKKRGGIQIDLMDGVAVSSYKTIEYVRLMPDKDET